MVGKLGCIESFFHELTRNTHTEKNEAVRHVRFERHRLIARPKPPMPNKCFTERWSTL